MSNTSWKTIAADLSDRIGRGELEVGSRIPSGEEIAGQWGVSRHTAHRAIHELQREGLVVRQRRWGTVVADRIKLKTKRTMFVVDRYAPAYNFPSTDLIRGMQDGLGEDIQLVIAECKGDWEIEQRHLEKALVEADGVILCPTSHPKNTPLLQSMIRGGFPLVILDRVPEGIEADAVVSDNEGVTLKALHSLEQRGHTRIGFFSFYKPNFSSVLERHSAYVKALAEVGVDDTTRYTRWFAQELDEHPQQFVQAVFDSLFTLVKQDDPVTALFCVQDSFAAAALQACERMGVSIPEDLELVTFNDWPPLMLRSPWSTHRIVQRHYEIGLTAARHLAGHKGPLQGPPQTLRVPADLLMADAGLNPASFRTQS
jgi:GntR family transcriptional regulator of arabinose operon